MTAVAETMVDQSEAQSQAQSQASGSSFYAGMRVLPKAEREAMFAVYAFCRQVDDIADDLGGDRGERRAGLDAWRADIEALYAGRDPGRAAIVAEPVRRFGLDKADFLAVIDGMQMDADEDIRAPDLKKLDLYCDRVASAVGRLSVRIFGMDHAPGLALAHHLGRALQLTNILRDLDEDAGMGRLYLPRELLDEAGVAGSDPGAVVADPRVDAACRALAGRAREHYRQAEAVMSARPRGRLAAPRLMRAVYGRILDRTEAAGWAPPRRRLKLSKPELLWILFRHGILG
jgi:presqualene diphosphate synthase